VDSQTELALSWEFRGRYQVRLFHETPRWGTSCLSPGFWTERAFSIACGALATMSFADSRRMFKRSYCYCRMGRYLKPCHVGAGRRRLPTSSCQRICPHLNPRSLRPLHGAANTAEANRADGWQRHPMLWIRSRSQPRYRRTRDRHSQRISALLPSAKLETRWFFPSDRLGWAAASCRHCWPIRILCTSQIGSVADDVGSPHSGREALPASAGHLYFADFLESNRFAGIQARMHKMAA
jgi:hypothetical protein